MFKNKPEVIDPEEKNLTYYSYRNKEEKKLEETSCCKSSKSFRPHFKMMIGLLIMVFVLYFFAQKNLSQQAQFPAEITTENFSLVLSVYQIKEEKKIYAQIMFQKPNHENTKIFLNRAHFVCLGIKNKVIAQSVLESQNIVFEDSALKTLTIEIEALKPAKKIKAFLVINGKEWALEKKLLPK